MIASRPIVLCWPNSGGYSRRNRVSPRCLLCDGAVLFCQSRSNIETHSRAVELWVNFVLVTVRRVKDAG